MISKQIMQSTLEGIAQIAQISLCVFDADGVLLAAAPGSDAAPEKESKAVREFAGSSADSQEIKDNLYFKVYDGEQLEYILSVRGSGDTLHLSGRMAAYQLSTLSAAYREKLDKDNFIKNLLMDNLLLVDISNRARKLHISEDERRVCLVIRPGRERRPGELEIVRAQAAGDGKGFVTEIDETDVIVVHGLPALKARKNSEDEWEAEVREAQSVREYAQELYQKLEEAGLDDFRISSGSVVSDLRDVSRSCKEARMALDVSRIFHENENIVSYGELGIGRLIYQLPLPLCRMFLSETFGTCNPDDIDTEIVDTVDNFFENSLNVSETARDLFVHRNTLVYRLDKLQKITGLDVRVFDDAMTYRIAMMVVKYMKYMQETGF